MKIKDIATALGISQSTVSKALSGATDVSEETKKRVLEYASENDFSAKKKGGRKRVCIFLEDMGTSNEFICFDVLSGFRQAASVYNYDVIVKSISKQDESGDYNYNDDMSKNEFLGAFIMGTNLNSKLYQQLKSTSHPSVILDNFISNPCVATISVDNINTLVSVVDYLAQLGHKRIGLLVGEKESAVSRERFSGYLCGLMNNNLEYNPNFVKFGNYTDACGQQFADEFIKEKLTAVVCASDLIATGLIQALKTRGVSVPQDISVTGFDNIALSRYISPPLTTVSQNFIDIGKNAFTMLRQLIKGVAPNRVVTTGELVVRDSTALPKK